MWVPPPGWPLPPPGWVPPAGWVPGPDWPAPPADWQFWQPRVLKPAMPPVGLSDPTRRVLVWETVCVLLAFLALPVTTAVVVLARHLGGTGDIDRFDSAVPGHPLAGFFLGMLSYIAVGAIVPLVLLLLWRSGVRPVDLGLRWPRLRSDWLPGLGLGVTAFATAVVVFLPFEPLLHHSRLVNHTVTRHVPAYYVVYALVLAATTAITEEVIVNGYLLTRLEQLNWTPNRALALSLGLRTSYHVYYGIALLFTVPFGYYVTRSFQKRRRLTRPITAHFLYDAVLTTVAVLTS